MKLYLYNREDGLSVTQLPTDIDGTVTVTCADGYGKPQRLLDVEGNGMEWTLYATINGGICYNDFAQESVVLRDGMCITVPAGRRSFYLISRDESQISSQVKFYDLPTSGTIAIGRSGCTINCMHPWIENHHADIRIDSAGAKLIASKDSRGAYVNGHSKNDVALKSGDVIDLFNLRIVYLGSMLALYSYDGNVSVNKSLPAHIWSNARVEEKTINIHMIPERETPYDRSPRMAPADDVAQITVEGPPPSQVHEETPLMLSVGSSAFMSISSVMMAMNAVTSAQASGAKLAVVLPSVVMAGGMFVGSLVMPIITRKYNDRSVQKKEILRQKKYTQYLERIDKQITSIGLLQRERRLKEYPTPEALFAIAAEREKDLWNRMPFHRDFLMLRLGLADLTPDVQVKYPTHNFSLEEDVMKDALNRLESSKHIVKSTPLMLSLRDEGIIGVLGDYSQRVRYVKGLLMQLCTLQSYREMKLVFIYSQEHEDEWMFARWLPHVWSDNGEFRAIGTQRDTMRNISAYIDALCNEGDRHQNDVERMCVVVLEDMVLGEQCQALTERMKNIQKQSMRVIALAGQSNDLPKECNSVIVVENTQGVLYKDIRKMSDHYLFELDAIPSERMWEFASKLCHTKLYSQLTEGKFVDTLTYYDMIRCGNVEQINALERWKNSNPVKSLAAPLGIDRYGSLMYLDIHQNAHGPHGLIAGMTGSGKSELIITYLLSMAINYSPLEVAFILIDYKGGGMSDTLSKLPHVVGVIDNLGGSQGIHRSLISIKSEILRRQLLFKEISERNHVSNLDIYKYQAMYRNGELTEPLQHLILVSDEFAELKEQESDFMDDLVSMARIGRSLGVHLILATQKPTGVVSPQIASNARFHVCMKVQDKGDSMEMLGRPEAALLTKTGRFYLQVGFNEIFEMGQSAWSGAISNPKPRYVEEQDNSFEFINDVGETIYKARPKGREDSSHKAKQVDAIVSYVREVAEENGLMPPMSWKPALKDEILLDDVFEEYHVTTRPYAIDPIIGVVDDPRHQMQYPLKLDLEEKGNTIVYGFSGAGKHELVNAAVYSLCKYHTADELNIYFLDFATESAGMFLGMPQVGDVIFGGEDEKVENFVSMLNDELVRRRKVLSSFGGSLEMYRKDAENAKKMPNLLVIVENYSAFSENYDRYDDDMYRFVREGNRFGVYFLITTTNPTSIRYRMTQNFKNALCLRMNERMDYTNVLGNVDGAVPMERLGSGLCKGTDGIVEFQIAFILPLNCEKMYEQIKNMSAEAGMRWKGGRAPRIPILPEHVSYADVCPAPKGIGLDCVPLGMEKDSMRPAFISLKEQFILPVVYNLLPEIPYLQLIGDLLAANEQRTVYLLDIKAELQNTPHSGYRYDSDANAICAVIKDVFQETVKRYNVLHPVDGVVSEKTDFAEIVVMIHDIKAIFDYTKPGTELTSMLDAMLLKGGADLNIFYVIEQDQRTMSSFIAHSWSNRLTYRDGVWLGDGIQMQSILKSDIRRAPDMGEQFGYLVHRGKGTLIKLIEER